MSNGIDVIGGERGPRGLLQNLQLRVRVTRERVRRGRGDTVAHSATVISLNISRRA